MILKSTDGGATWSSQSSGTTEDLLGMEFPATDTFGYCVGTSGTILRTLDGSTWATMTSGTTVTLRAVSAPTDGQVAYVCGDSGVVLRTTDFGLTWGSISVPDVVTLQSLYAPDPLTAFAGASTGDVYRTTSGAPPWAVLPTGTSNAGLAFANTLDGWVVGSQIRLTTNGGKHWSTSPDHSVYPLRAIWIDPTGKIGYAAGDSGIILRTTTGGK